MSNLLKAEIQWYWEKDENGLADCGLLYAKGPGHAYSIARCPKYQSQQQWVEDAQAIKVALETHNMLLDVANAFKLYLKNGEKPYDIEKTLDWIIKKATI